jgi:F0F1-type ATP synthase beta subunit
MRSRCSASRNSAPTHRRAGQALAALSYAAVCGTEAFSGVPGRSAAVADTIAGCRALLAGERDEWRESSLYRVGTLDEARDKEKASYTAAQPALEGQRHNQ